MNQIVELELASSFYLEQEVRDNSRIRVSGIGDCRRKIVYRVRGYQEGRPEPPHSAHLYSIFELGHGLHLKLQERISNTGPLKWVDADPIIDERGKFGWTGNCEIHLEHAELGIAGHCDALTRPLSLHTVELPDGTEFQTLKVREEGWPGAQRYVIDFKTITARERAEIHRHPETGQILKAEIKPSAFEKLKQPKPEHVQQAMLYAWLTTQPGFHTDRIDGPLSEMPGVIIIYIAKDLAPDYYAQHPEQYADPRGLLNAPYKAFVLDPKPQVVRLLQKKITAVNEHLSAGTLPPRDFHHTPERPAWECVGCPFNEACYAEEGFFAGSRPALPNRLQVLLSLDSAPEGVSRCASSPSQPYADAVVA